MKSRASPAPNQPKETSLKTTAWVRPVLAVLCLTFLQGSASCLTGGIEETVDRNVDKAVAAIDRAIAALEQQSGAWQNTLKDLQSQLTKDLQTTLANEVQNLMSRGIALTSLSVKCGADFAGDRMKQGLLDLKAKLLKKPIAPRQPHFCEVVPDHVNLGARRETNAIVSFYGYDMDLSEPAKVKVFLVDQNGSEVEVTGQNVATPSGYQLTLNVANNGVAFTPTSAKVVLRWQSLLLGSLLVLQPPPAQPPPVVNKVPFFRVYNPGNGDHFYTTNAGERDNAIQAHGYKNEGVACQIYPSQVSGTVSLFRLLNPGNGDHFYTTSESERLGAMGIGYRFEGVAGYVYAVQAAGTVPLFRLVNPGNGDHFYTANATERDRAAGYNKEGIACYVFPP
jgi:hypothetical protein